MAAFYATSAPVKAAEFLSAAIKGGELAWELYGQHALFVAGDYVPSVDKEASLFALRAFMALADATRASGSGQLWLDRASDTALFVGTLHHRMLAYILNALCMYVCMPS